ncbi:hypothetical protein BJ170DRAFT_598895 [Xylariales sp. AK1849]|nr:hypothetical protein BJ170DRAFT_598895 [Xylariales sp. AK1849]
MATPSDKTLEKELYAFVHTSLRSDNIPTANEVRKHVEAKLELDEGFFQKPEWKDRSKTIIKKAAADFDAQNGDGGKEENAEPEPTKKNGVKRQSSEEPERKPKRVKKEPPPEKAVKKAAPRKKAAPKKKRKASSESELSELDDSEEEEEKPKKKGRKAAPKKTKEHVSESELSDLGSSEEETKPKMVVSRSRPKKKAADSSEEDGSDFDNSSADRKRKYAAPATKRGSKRAKVESDSEDDLGDKKNTFADDSESEVKDEIKAASSPLVQTKIKSIESDEDDKPKDSAKDEKRKSAADEDSSDLSSVLDEPPPKEKSISKAPSAPTEEIKPEADDDSSELSSVLDEPPPRKRKSKDPKGSSKPKVSNKAAPKELTGDEGEIKKLQGQLVKCGVRKIWAFELKEHGEDSRAKIRHLKKMLSDMGMDGRFSEAKAKEVKERRELMADLEAVQDMNTLWGSEGRGGRASRSKAKTTLKEPSDDDDEEDEDAGDVKPRVSKRQADLAFLGSESESE